MGAFARQRDLKLKSGLRYRFAGVAVIAGFMWMPWCTSYAMNGEIWRYTGTLETMNPWIGKDHSGEVMKFFVRLAVPCVQAACVWAFLHVVPWRKTRALTGCGRRSLACYIFHPLSGMVFS